MKVDPAILIRIPIFNQISIEDIPRVLSCLHASTGQYKKGSFIRTAGDPADFIGIVLAGSVQILQDGYDGKRTLTSTFGPEAMFAQAFACSGSAELPVSIMAAADCEILFLSVDHILSDQGDACGFHRIMLRNLLQIVAQKNILLNHKLSCVSHKTTAEKLMAFLHDQSRLHHAVEFTIPYDRQALADYLGVERSAMSAEIGKLQRQGLLQTKGSWFRLCQDQSATG